MNFLSHVAVVEPIQDPLVTAGAVLPDLLRHVGLRHHRRPETDAGLSEAARRVLRGVRYHVATDAFFHYCPWFGQTLKGLQQSMADEGNPLANHWSRWLLPHVLIEIVTDAHIAEVRPDLPKGLYNSLQDFARHDCCPEVCGLYEADPDRLGGWIDILIGNRRVETYNTTCGVADALRRVLAKEGKEVLSAASEPLLGPPIAWLRERLRDGEDIILIVRKGIGLTG
ncbi:MAG: hypothetical protein GXP25_04130 [Planctomycetes bacterium]|nr:hypothetical protein [Planctomycetota bacterium]